MKYQKPSAEEVARIAEVRAIRQRYYEVLANGEAAEVSGNARGYVVGKGPRGKWYVKNGKEIIEGPFEDEAGAKARIG